MADNDIDLLAIDRGSETAPAGCGKTQPIARTLTRHDGGKPILVLTHTNAGVVALRGRLDRAGVPANAYSLSTIDGWAMRLIQTFPARSGHKADLPQLARPRTDYPAIRLAAAELLRAGHSDDILAANYARLIVDEYRDCSIRQHAVIACAAKTLPTCVVGDPMRAIFGFGGDRLAKWTEEVRACFPPVGELDTPWRWTAADAEPLGYWLLEVPVEIGKQGGVSSRRPAVPRACIAALRLCEGTDGLSFEDAAIRMRERNRYRTIEASARAGGARSKPLRRRHRMFWRPRPRRIGNTRPALPFASRRYRSASWRSRAPLGWRPRASDRLVRPPNRAYRSDEPARPGLFDILSEFHWTLDEHSAQANPARKSGACAGHWTPSSRSDRRAARKPTRSVCRR